MLIKNILALFPNEVAECSLAEEMRLLRMFRGDRNLEAHLDFDLQRS